MIPAALLILAQAAAPAPAADPLAANTFAQSWAWAMSLWSDAPQRRDLVGGRIQAQVGIGRWGIAARADASGLPGEFQPNQPSTFRTVEVYVAGHRNLAGVQNVVIGPTALAGAGVSLETVNGKRPTTPNTATAGVGVRAAGPDWAVYVVVGCHQALRGVSVVAVVHVGMTDRTAWVADGGIGAHGALYARMGLAVRVF